MFGKKEMREHHSLPPFQAVVWRADVFWWRGV
jgi:hypothetical protein